MKYDTIHPLGIPFTNCACSMNPRMNVEALKVHLSQTRAWTYHNLSAMRKMGELRNHKGLIHAQELQEYRLENAEIEEMMSTINGASNDFATRLQDTYGLKRDKIVLCSLILLGASNREIMILLDMKEDTIKKDKQRLKTHTFHLAPETTLRDFLVGFQDGWDG